MDLDERSAYIALALTPGIGAARLDLLLSRFGSALGALSAPFEFLCTTQSISVAAATAIGESARVGVEPVLRDVERLGAHCLLPTDPGFPVSCREIPDRPTLLFALGDLSLLERPAVAIVGSRDHSEYGGEVGREVAAGAAGRGLVVVSGMARGLDAVAHAAALEAGGTTIGVLGNGLGVVYPAANRKLYQQVLERGLLITECPPGERPGIGAFPRRNRLISALSRVTLVVEAAIGSGALITVGTALAQGKDVMAVPGNITSPTSVGTNQLIRDGAEPYLVLEDLLAHYPEAVDPKSPEGKPAPKVKETPVAPPGLGAAETRIFEILARGPKMTDDLIMASQLVSHVVLAALSTLELLGLAVQERGSFRITG